MVKIKEDLTDKKFDRLTVIKQAEDYIRPNGKHEAMWWCQCNCGNPNLVKVIGYQLTHGHTRSCGCLKREVQIQNGLKTKNLIPNTKNIMTMIYPGNMV